MTCEECDAIGDKPNYLGTRAELAALIRHLLECERCQARAAADLEADPMSPEEEAAADDRLLALYDDPEV